MLLRGISAVSSALTTIWPPRSPYRSCLHDELVHSAQKIGGRVCVLQILLCQGQHRTMQQAHARVKGNTAQFSRESGAAPHNSASAFGERFFVETRFGKCRRTLCTRKGHAASVRRQSRQRLRNTSSFPNRWTGKKDPARPKLQWCGDALIVPYFSALDKRFLFGYTEFTAKQILLRGVGCFRLRLGEVTP